MKEYEKITQNELNKLILKAQKLEEELGVDIDITVEPDIEELNIEQPEKYLDDLEEKLEELEDNEPFDGFSDEYDEWEDKYDENEELIEEVSELKEQKL